MGATGYEVKMYADITRIANALERIARVIEEDVSMLAGVRAALLADRRDREEQP